MSRQSYSVLGCKYLRTFHRNLASHTQFQTVWMLETVVIELPVVMRRISDKNQPPNLYDLLCVQKQHFYRVCNWHTALVNALCCGMQGEHRQQQGATAGLWSRLWATTVATVFITFCTSICLVECRPTGVLYTHRGRKVCQASLIVSHSWFVHTAICKVFSANFTADSYYWWLQ
jgi:hypothetical protein